MKKIIFQVILLMFCFCTTQSENIKNYANEKVKSEISCQEIMQNMFQAVHQISTLRYDMKAMERIDMKMVHTQAAVKLQILPRKIYFKNAKSGQEVLWVSDENKGEALINPNAFPYFDLSLDPYGNLMRRNQHHTIFEIGFSYMSHTIEGLAKREKSSFENYFQLSGTVVFDGKVCDIISINYPQFAYVTYTAHKGETLVSIARQLNVSEYEILQKNKFSDYDVILKEGENIQVPNNYSSKSILYIDTNTYLPLFVQIYDEKGLFEQYEFHNLQVNPFISPEEFTKKYPEYHF